VAKDLTLRLRRELSIPRMPRVAGYVHDRATAAEVARGTALTLRVARASKARGIDHYV
jgi:hypothetical protein